MTANLLPCPFCGAKTDPESVCYGEVDGIDAEAICCPECESQGPYGINNAIAVESWNKRATHERQPAASTQLADELDEMREELFADMKPGVELLDRVVAFLRAAPEPEALPNTPTNRAQARRDAERLIDEDRPAAIDAIVRASQPPSEAHSLLQSIVRHWWEFGIGDGMDEKLHHANEYLRRHGEASGEK